MQYNLIIPHVSLKEFSNYIYIATTFAGVITAAYRKGKKAVNAIVTTNNNRIRDEVITAVTASLKIHEDNSALRLGKLESSHTALQANVADIVKTIAEIKAAADIRTKMLAELKKGGQT